MVADRRHRAPTQQRQSQPWADRNRLAVEHLCEGRLSLLLKGAHPTPVAVRADNLVRSHSEVAIRAGTRVIHRRDRRVDRREIPEMPQLLVADPCLQVIAYPLREHILARVGGSTTSPDALALHVRKLPDR